MKFFISILLTALVSFVACLFLPWWVIAIVGFVVAFIVPLKPSLSFVSGFGALFLLWTLLSFFISRANGHILAHKVSMVILKADNPFLLMLVTGIIGGLVAGLGSLSGRLFKNLLAAKK